MIQPFATVGCSVDIYPFEGGVYTLTGGQIIACNTTKNIYGDATGSFSIVLAPGGPNGPESIPDWCQIITPMSFVMIGMQRGSVSEIVMLGVVTYVGETQEWVTAPQGSSAGRLTTIQGMDFSYFFTSFNWTALTLFGLTAGTAFGESVGLPASAGLPYLLAQGSLGGNSSTNSNPAEIGQIWFNSIMMGSGSIMGKTFVPYSAGSQILLSGAFKAVWEEYLNIYIPTGEFFLADQGSWVSKFQHIFPFPWYEFFVTTAPSGAYSVASGIVSSGYAFTMRSMPTAQPVSPTVVARVNPLPAIDIKVTGPGDGGTLQPLDLSRWNALNLYSFSGVGFYASQIGFSTQDVRNFYLLNPTGYRPAYGFSNTQTTPFYFYFMAAGDSASIHRYGYRPELADTRWLFDMQGSAAQNQDLNVPQTVATLTARMLSYYEPTPLMARARVNTVLQPDILIGNRFRYQPFKDNTDWDFYIETVSHSFSFGGRSTTTLGLCRGLPASIYSNASASGVLQAIHVGNAQRLNGQYQVGLPSGSTTALQTIGQPPHINSFLANVGQAYVTPQQK